MRGRDRQGADGRDDPAEVSLGVRSLVKGLAGLAAVAPPGATTNRATCVTPRSRRACRRIGFYRDCSGFRTLDSAPRAKSVFGQDDVILVSQHFHLARALFLAAHNGLNFEGYEAADVPPRHDLTTKPREAAARLWAFGDVLAGRAARFGGAPVALVIDPPTRRSPP